MKFLFIFVFSVIHMCCHSADTLNHFSHFRLDLGISPGFTFVSDTKESGYNIALTPNIEYRHSKRLSAGIGYQWYKEGNSINKLSTIVYHDLLLYSRYYFFDKPRFAFYSQIGYLYGTDINYRNQTDYIGYHAPYTSYSKLLPGVGIRLNLKKIPNLSIGIQSNYCIHLIKPTEKFKNYNRNLFTVSYRLPW